MAHALSQQSNVPVRLKRAHAHENNETPSLLAVVATEIEASLPMAAIPTIPSPPSPNTHSITKCIRECLDAAIPSGNFGATESRLLSPSSTLLDLSEACLRLGTSMMASMGLPPCPLCAENNLHHLAFKAACRVCFS